MCALSLFLSLQPVIPTSPTSSCTTPTSTMGMGSKMDSSTLQDVFILSPMSGLYGPRYPLPFDWFCILGLHSRNFRLENRKSLSFYQAFSLASALVRTRRAINSNAKKRSQQLVHWSREYSYPVTLLCMVENEKTLRSCPVSDATEHSSAGITKACMFKISGHMSRPHNQYPTWNLQFDPTIWMHAYLPNFRECIPPDVVGLRLPCIPASMTSGWG